MLKWTNTIEIKDCNSCPFFSIPDCRILELKGIEEKAILDGNKKPEFCPLLKNNFLIKLEYKPKVKAK